VTVSGALPIPSAHDDVDPLADPHRIASARRLLLEVRGHAAFDRLSGLAARLVGAGHAKVTLFAEEDQVVGGFGLPDGVVGGPALLTGALSAIVVREQAPLAITEAQADVRVADLPAVTSGQVSSYLGVPLVSASGHAVGALAVYDPAPHLWSGDDRELLVQLAASVVSELELSAAQSAVGTSLTRLEVALEASAVGIWERDLRTGSVYWDERCAAIFGLSHAVEIGSVERLMMEHIHPEDHDMVTRAMREAEAGDGQYVIESRVLRADGAVRWTMSRGRIVTDSRGERVRVIGTVVDVTEARELAARRLAAVQRSAAVSQVAAELAGATEMAQLADITLRGAQVLGADSGGFAVFDGISGELRVHLGRRLSEAVEGQIELPPEGVLVELDDELPTQYVARHGEAILLATAEEAAARFPRMAELTAVLGIHALAALPLRVEDRLLGTFVATWPADHEFSPEDVELLEALTAQIALSVSRLRADAVRAAAEAAMVEANARLQLLAEAGRVLSGTLDFNEQIEQLAELVVPGLGDWCWIVVTDEQDRLYAVASAHRDPARRDELQSYVRSMVEVMSGEAAARVVMDTGRPLVLPVIDHDYLARALPDPAVLDVALRLDPGSGAVVPLVARGETLGALGIFTRRSRGPLGGGQIDTAVEIGRRAGLALHHTRLYGQQRELAVALQRSMLTAPPDPEHAEIVVRYVPAAAGAEIGGDWYDAFLQTDGATMLAIGDVVGHDTRAAAAMGQVRGLLRGIGYAVGGSPAEVLAELDRAVDGLALDTMATALVARLEHQDAPVPRTSLRWSSAGHLPVAVLGPDGTAALLDDRADLLLGVAPGSPRTEHVAVLEEGATVLLYTDGLVERRDRDIDDGTAELLQVLEECAGLPLGRLCDRVLERLFLPYAQDDVAMLAVRLLPRG
jgi:PAS domain S-box-containing protein